MKDEELIERMEREMEQAARAKSTVSRPFKRVSSPLAEKLASYCRNRAYCRKELEELLPFYGRRLEEWIMTATARHLSVDELVMLVGRHLLGEATDEDIAKYLEAKSPAPRRPPGPRLSIVFNRLRSAFGGIFKRRIR